jgi:coenzyme F420-reducing hydrogenase alpha subunit
VTRHEMEQRLERMERALRSVRNTVSRLMDLIDEFEEDLQEPTTFPATTHVSAVARPLD